VLVRFQREAALLARLRHSNVVQVHNFGRYVTDYFIVMDLLGNLTLETALERRFAFQAEYAVVIVAQVLSGLEALHAEGVVHRDVKPANVMLEPDRAVVMDLGLAHVSDASRLTVSGQILGTPSYMAPEQARGEPVTVQTDLHAAGVMIFELLTGATPYQAGNVHSLVAKIAREEPERVTHYRQDLSPALVAALRRMLARDPGERFESAASARSALLAGMGMQWSQVEGWHRQMYREVKAAVKTEYSQPSSDQPPAQ
jgi:serine/threonine-protein kinase